MTQTLSRDVGGQLDDALSDDPEPRRRLLPIISVDDHLIEPPDLFEGRLPKAYADRAPKVVEVDGRQVWEVDGRQELNIGLSAVAGRPRDSWSRDPVRFDVMRRGCWDIDRRVADMDINGVGASICFPSGLIGFCGSKLLQVKDDDFALALLRGYNTWQLEVWHGRHPTRIIPMQMPYLQDAKVAAQEIRSNAELGFRALSFCEDPAKLGLASIWSGYWDPVLAACEETGTVLCLHVASSGWNPTVAKEAPPAMRPIHFMSIALIAATDWLWSGIPTRYPKLKIVMSEGGVGWVPVLARRSDYVMNHAIAGEEAGAWTDSLLPSEVLKRNFWFCLLDEPLSPEVVYTAGIDHLLAESDYPHADGTWPNTQDVMAKRLSWLDEKDALKVSYRNAEALFDFKLDEAQTQTAMTA